jgi:hypothetical protein
MLLINQIATYHPVQEVDGIAAIVVVNIIHS